MPKPVYPENFREDIRETLRPLKREQVAVQTWYNPIRHCGCPVTELVIRKGWAERDLCERELNGSSYFDILRDKYPFNAIADFINSWDNTFPKFSSFTPIEVANLIFRRDDERSNTG